ncbi:Uncharacterised protein [Shewanella baltica]|nr:Uncharacterised protein [Shewanella baltica]
MSKEKNKKPPMKTLKEKRQDKLNRQKASD